MPDANELIAALERLITGTASETDCSALRNALITGVLVTGVRAQVATWREESSHN